ncbi:MAG: ABC transporter ATP-binding protein, partial [Deltaproteobacteria bacterium]|nr:ABC transporter ATP-binding protein [Deltaproteobacteria bacterium]
VMYAGKIVEYTDTKTLFAEPLPPYTIGLLNSLPTMEREAEVLKTIPGAVPGLLNLPPGCSFYDRCPKADTVCTEHEPELVEIKKEHLVACYKA